MSPSSTSRKCKRAAAFAAVAVACSAPSSVVAFAPHHQPSASSATALSAEAGRRDALRSIFGAAVVSAAAAVSVPGSASASYSAYANREKDWEERITKGEIQISTARDLRAQLQEIVPQNSESSKVFCPNGPSAAVSPLMENKCNDRLAMPSVYGRTEDITGNSIPGFKGGKYSAVVPGGGGSLTAETGGFPSYYKK